MSRRSPLTLVVCVSLLVLGTDAGAQSQAPAAQTPTLGQRLLGNQVTSCRVSAPFEIEVTFLDKSTTRVNVPAPPPPLSAPAPSANPGTSPGGTGTPAASASNPFIAAILAAQARTKGPVAPPTRGFDERGQPYVEVKSGDGSVQRYQMDGVTVTRRDGTTEFTRATSTNDAAQAGAPPELSADPMRGRGWIELQSSAMLAVIRGMVNDDAGQIARFNLAEARATDGDLLAQMAYRATVARFFATTPGQ